ncbi:MAG: 2-C-methyl-D-erythritol 4-phosphate cytidylyltransferase [Desulfonauticus sp.]|nr:2-C-methyl-D-erythritol 4-phosphate cytidylyltransferase [Desulfonauticus sp.]
MADIANLWAIILAAGQSSRLKKQGLAEKKQFLFWKGLPLFVHSLNVFSAIPLIKGVVLVFSEEDFDKGKKLCASYFLKEHVPVLFCTGGELRQDSVFNGLLSLPEECSHVFIHDGARPFLTPALVQRLIENYLALPEDVGVVPGIAVSDTIKEVDAEARVRRTLPRSKLKAIQTPQLFELQFLKKAHLLARSQNIEATDDAMLWEIAGGKIIVVEGDVENIKITTKEDLVHLKNMSSSKEKIFVSGFGYDVHRYGGDKPLILGGIPISQKVKVEAHSDGDVLFHALVDALLGCLGAGDIGELFPDSDKRYANLASSIFVSEVMILAQKKGFTLTNVDITIVAQSPKISPFKKQIQKNVANLLALPKERVNIKATTEERLGFTGAGEGLKAMVLATGYFWEEKDVFV